MKKIAGSLIIIIFLLSNSVYSQEPLGKDPKAKKILDKISKVNKTYKTILIKFTYTLENAKEKTSEKFVGTAFLKGKKYKLTITGTEILSDGKTVWTYMKDAEEVTITEPNAEDESITNPTNLFSIYEKGFKYQYQSQEKKGNTVKDIIDLFPEKPKTKKFSRVRLTVDSKKNQICSIKTFGNDGNHYTIVVDEFKSGTDMPDDMFNFDVKKYPKGTEVIDGRE